MKKLLLVMIVYLCCVRPASAASLTELTPYVSSQYFTWIEQDQGQRLLKESGSLFSAGVLLGVSTNSPLTLRVKGEIFGGVVGYDGETQAPDFIPVRTDVNYFGTKQELDLGVSIPSASLRFEPFGGLGYRWWMRDLQDATSADGKAVAGYTELWQTLYGRLGARVRFPTPAGAVFYAEGGAKYPFYTGNSINFIDIGTVTLRPVGRWSAFAETGVAWRRLKITVFYEGFRFAQSQLAAAGSDRFFQPDSSSDIYGLSCGWIFR